MDQKFKCAYFDTTFLRINRYIRYDELSEIKYTMADAKLIETIKSVLRVSTL